MAGDVLKVLGQQKPVANTLTALYTVPASTATAVSSITCCNQNTTTDDAISVSVAVAGAADNVIQYLYSNLPVGENDTFTVTIGITLGAGDVIRVKSANGFVSFNAFGVEQS